MSGDRQVDNGYGSANPRSGHPTQIALNPKMKSFLAALILATVTPLFANEIKFETAPWDSLAIPLEINAYYLSIDSSVEAKSAKLELELLVKGVFVRTIELASLAMSKPKALKFDAAIYLKKPESDQIPGFAATTWGVGGSRTPFTITTTELPAGSIGGAALPGKIPTSGRTAAFYIVSNKSGGITFHDSISETIKANPEASLLVGYLKTE